VTTGAGAVVVFRGDSRRARVWWVVPGRAFPEESEGNQRTREGGEEAGEKR
jgi:hypothetical protein